MRFRLILTVDRRSFGDLLPINYQYEQSAVIYRILSKASEEYADWLHHNGFQLESGRPFKLFTFSRLKIDNRQILPRNERIRILSDSVEWQISFLPEKSTEKFIQGLFANQAFEIGDRQSTVRFMVKNIEVIPPPAYTHEMDFITMSPICLRMKCENGGSDYLSPVSPHASSAILTGLSRRYEVFYGKPYSGEEAFDFSVLNEPKSVLIKIKSDTPEQTKVRGYMCRFRMKAPLELMKIMYESGIGEECSQGFGCVKETDIKRVIER